MYTLEILSWVDELNTLCDHDSWKMDLMSCAVTAASEAPVFDVAAALAKVLTKPAEIPSLLKDKTERLFLNWKNTKIAVNEAEPSSRKESGKEKVMSSPEIFKSLFSIYEEKCEENAGHMSSEGDTSRRCFSYVNKYPTESSNGTCAAAGIKKEFGRFLALFIEMTFMRDVQKFPQHTSPVPLLVQFSEVLRKREFEGLKMRSKVHRDLTALIGNSVKQSSHSPSSACTLTTPEKKGLFRSLDYTSMVLGGSKTVLLSPIKRCMTSSSKDTPNSLMSQPQTLPNLSVRKMPSLRVRGRHRSLSRKKRMYASVSRARSLSVGSRPRVVHQESAQQQSVPSDLKVSQSIRNSSNKESPMLKLMCLPECFPNSIKHLEIQDTLNLLNWMMSRERQLCPRAVESDGLVLDASGQIKVTLNDLMLSIQWRDLFKCWSIIKDKKSCLENTTEDLKKRNEKEKPRIVKATDSYPHNTREVSKYDDVQTEVDQGRTKSMKAKPEKEPQMETLNVLNKVCTPEEHIEHEEQDERSHYEPDTEVMKNPQLSENQDATAPDKENVHTDESEKHSPLPSMISNTRSRSSSTILSDILNLESSSKGEGVDSMRAEGQGMEGCSKESSVATHTHPEDPDQQDDPPATQVICASQTTVEKTECVESSLVCSHLLEKQEKGKMSDMKTGKQERICSDLDISQNEGLVYDGENAQTPVKVSCRNTTKGQQVKVRAEEAKQFVPSRQSIQVHFPHRARKLTGVEAPDTLSDPNITPLGRLLRVPPEAAQGSKSRLPELWDSKNFTSSKSDRKSAEDTLDSVTLPDSLHASDLEEESDLESSGLNTQDDAMEGSKCELVHGKSEEWDTGVDAPLQNIHSASARREGKREAFDGKSKKRQERFIAKKREPCDIPHHWDHGELHLRSLPVQVKTVKKTVSMNDVDEVDGLRDVKNITHVNEKDSKRKKMKLLTLPKISSTENGLAKLQLKQLPTQHVHRLTATEKLNRNQNAIFSSLECKMEDMRPLIIPKYFDSHPKKDGKTNTLSFLSPQQVFAFCKHSSLKSPSGKFKTLKVSQKYMLPDSEWQSDVRLPSNSERKDLDTSDQVREDLDKGFLDQVKNYTNKYKKGNYKTILRGSNEASERESMLHDEPSETELRLDDTVQRQPQPSGGSRLVENNESFIDGNHETNSGIENFKDNLQPNHSSEMNFVKRKVENKSINTEPHEVMLKAVRAQGTQVPDTGTQWLGGHEPPQLTSGSAVQVRLPSLISSTTLFLIKYLLLLLH